MGENSLCIPLVVIKLSNKLLLKSNSSKLCKAANSAKDNIRNHTEKATYLPVFAIQINRMPHGR